MKKYISFLLVAIMLGAGTAYAESNSGSSDSLRPDREAVKAAMEARKELFKTKMEEEREAFRQQLEEKRDAFRAEVETRREEFKNATREMKLKFWDGAKRMLGERFAVAVRNMERLQERVASIIEKLKEDGEDTGAAEEYLETSKDKLADAKSKVDEIKALIPESGEEITPEVFEQIKLKAREARDLIKESHNALKNAVRELKALRDDSGDDSDELDS